MGPEEGRARDTPNERGNKKYKDPEAQCFLGPENVLLWLKCKKDVSSRKGTRKYEELIELG